MGLWCVQEMYRARAAGAAVPANPPFPLQLWWDRWLWRNDPMQDTCVLAPLNRCHLYGLLVCRALPLCGVVCGAPLSTLVTDRTLCVCDAPVDCMNIVQLCDTLANLRERWVRTKAWGIGVMKELLTCLAARLGMLSMQCWGEGACSMLDDECCEPVEGGGRIRVTRRCLRQNINVLMVLLRSVCVHAAAVDPDAVTEVSCSLQIVSACVRRHDVNIILVDGG